MMVELDPLLFSSTYGSALPFGWGWVAWFSTSLVVFLSRRCRRPMVRVGGPDLERVFVWATPLCRIWFDSGVLVDLVWSFRVFSLASVAVIGSYCVLVVVRSD